jgi:hypothetical protein
VRVSILVLTTTRLPEALMRILKSWDHVVISGR